MVISGVEHMRRVNLSTALRTLHAAGPLSRSELGGRLGLTRSTTGVLAADLTARGLAFERSGPRLGMPGRPSPVLHPNESGVAVVAAQVAVNYMVVALVGLSGRVLGLRRTERERPRLGPEQTVHDLATMISGLVADAPPGCRMAGIGVAVCGVVRTADAHVVLAPNLGWHDVPLGALLAEAMSPEVPITVANDVDAAAIGEHARGAGVGTDHLVYIGGEIGVGAGVIVAGRLLLGPETSVGEIGHWPVNPGGHSCRCGATGCWETEVGYQALVRAAGLPDKPPYREVVADILAAAREHAAWAEGAVRRVGSWIGIGLASVSSTFAPQVIVLGGFLADLLPLIEDQVLGSVGSSRMLPRQALPRIVASELGVRATSLGMAELALEPLLADPHAFRLISAEDIRSQADKRPLAALGGGDHQSEATGAADHV